MSSPRLTSLVIHRYRHVVPGTRLEFGAGFNVLLGRNGTGKTTLLELIEMIWSKGFARIADEPFHLEYTVEFDALTPTTAVEKLLPGFLIHVDVENTLVETLRSDSKHSRIPSPQPRFRYRVTMATLADEPVLHVEGTPMGASLRIGRRSAQVAVVSAKSSPLVWSAPRLLFNAPFADEEASEDTPDLPIIDWALWCSVILTDIKNTGRYDESLGAFQALTSNEYRSFGFGFEGASWEVERRLDRQTKVYPHDETAYAFFPRSLIYHWHQRLAADPKLEPPEFQDSIRDTRIAVFLELTGYSDVVIRSGTPARDRDGIIENLKFRTPEFRIILENDRGEIPAQSLSYGEKRLLAFLWHLACDPSIVIADELVNGFHHEWIERCVGLITGRQAFLASQNPLLLDCLPLASEDDVRRSFITCRREADGQMSWKNLSPEEAAEFYRSYQRQTRYTHEILRGQGLW